METRKMSEQIKLSHNVQGMSFSQPFTEKGKCLDEITFDFDDGKKLYVSENFLRYVSPVFAAMFGHDWKEKTTRTVNLKEKCYEDFLEFLLCLHPNVQKPVTSNNVLQIVQLAEEYQADLLLKKCKTKMSAWLKQEVQAACQGRYELDKLQRARTCLKILTKAISLNYQNIVKEICCELGAFGHEILTGSLPKDQVSKPWNTEEQVIEDSLADCKCLFEKLPLHLKYYLILGRLRLKDNTEMIELEDYIKQ